MEVVNYILFQFCVKIVVPSTKYSPISSRIMSIVYILK